jgi:hypothetical protein
VGTAISSTTATDCEVPVEQLLRFLATQSKAAQPTIHLVISGRHITGYFATMQEFVREAEAAFGVTFAGSEMEEATPGQWLYLRDASDVEGSRLDWFVCKLGDVTAFSFESPSTPAEREPPGTHSLETL